MHCQEHTHKVLIVGDKNVGKSSYVKRYVNGNFNYKQPYKMTVGVDFAVKVLQWSDTETVRLHLWDIAGQESFISMTRVYYKGASGCVVMFDMTEPSSFLHARQWKQDVDTKAMLPNGDPIPCILVANKCDLGMGCVSSEKIKEFSEANGFIGWMETSVKDNRNIQEPLRFLVENMLSSGNAVNPHPPQKVDNLQQDSTSARDRGCC
ncbi:ras-related protein Rab-7L1-like [Hypomesus transpacificus]|uniref:ras-related protein Rab-7L1-like n=1 Tax=Hypomesus transpacificus TaxID=137520 RepID=UPI001F07A9B1|nr:ras-related protein Rab-7L1-like [Hypomesus transpacificus]